jgi:hypothetical protein
MFGRSKPVVFDPYRRRRSRFAVPRWLTLLLLGGAAGVTGVVYVQRAWLPPRLSASDSASLRLDYRQADADRTQLRAELAQAHESLSQAQAEVQRLGATAAAAKEDVITLRADLAAAVDALPPDPRAGIVAVRSAHFSVDGGHLAYEVVLSRDQSGAKPVDGVMKFVVSGASAGLAETAVTLRPVPLTIGRLHVARGNLPLPDGFKPRQVTIKLVDKSAGRQLGMRVLLVD